MTAKTLEEEVREFAREWCRVNGKNSRHVRIQFTVDFVTARSWKIGGFRSAATARDKEIEELRARVKELEDNEYNPF